MSACAPFRDELERALAGPSAVLARLARHAHLGDCPACRAELARERALDGLLERLPAPMVPATLARTVLARLAGQRRTPDEPARGPRGDVEDLELDELLGCLPAPLAPPGLAGRILERVAPARAPERPNSTRRSRLLLLAAALLAALALWGRAVLRPAPQRIELAQGGDAELEADEELLAYAVERWELLNDEDLDLWLASLAPLDELLIEYADGETWLDDGSQQAASTGD